MPGPAVLSHTEVRQLSDQELLRAWRVSHLRLQRLGGADQASARGVMAHLRYFDELLRRHPGGFSDRVVEESPVRSVPVQRRPPAIS